MSIQLPSLGPIAEIALTVVIPAYNERERLPLFLPLLLDELADFKSAEILVIDDGSEDGTADAAQAALASYQGDARVVRCPWNGGKGSSVRIGVGLAQGDVIVFMDADMATDVHGLPALLEGLDGAEVAVGSRTVAGADVHGRSLARKLSTWVFNRVVRLVTGVPQSDTQCGFKAFRAEPGKLLLSLCRTDGFAFDVEVLLLARRMGYRVAEVPVRWESRDGGHVRPLRDPAAMLADVLRIRCRLRRRATGPRAAGSTGPEPAAGRSVATARTTRRAPRAWPR